MDTKDFSFKDVAQPTGFCLVFVVPAALVTLSDGSYGLFFLLMLLYALGAGLGVLLYEKSPAPMPMNLIKFEAPTARRAELKKAA